jgi:divalent metal cation (Fe/Co/Zn/Cd) transporter
MGILQLVEMSSQARRQYATGQGDTKRRFASARLQRCGDNEGSRPGVHLQTHGVEPSDETSQLTALALRLEYGTVAWNVGEAFLTIGLGAIASSLALIGFGTVSVVEVFASVVVVWHLRPARKGRDSERTARAHRLVAIAFGVLAVTLLVLSTRDLLIGRRPDESPWGIAYLGVTAAVMFGLAMAKRRVARRLGSSPLEAEAAMTFLDGVLSTSTMLGLLLNATLGWWWADPAAALFVALAAFDESRENWMEAAEGS